MSISFFFFKQKTAYEMRISDWSSDVCSSDLQTILDTINMVPGVSFQNNDAYGSSGGQLTIRGFSSDRISLTFDGVPLNDSGNYAIYSNQQLHPELIEQVHTNLGTPDVDSPTAPTTAPHAHPRPNDPTPALA